MFLFHFSFHVVRNTHPVFVPLTRAGGVSSWRLKGNDWATLWGDSEASCTEAEWRALVAVTKPLQPDRLCRLQNEQLRRALAVAPRTRASLVIGAVWIALNNMASSVIRKLDGAISGQVTWRPPSAHRGTELKSVWKVNDISGRVSSINRDGFY